MNGMLEAVRAGRRTPPRGRAYAMPEQVLTALAHVFGRPVEHIAVIEHSRYAKVHWGAAATTRPNRILLAIGGDDFVSNPELVLHEYFHVVAQWSSGRLTRWRYLVESALHGYWNNRFEREAREFSAAMLEPYHAYLKSGDDPTCNV